MTVREFLAHKTPGKSRVFAIDSDRPQFLDAVTSLGADDLHRTDDLLDGLNFFLITRDENDLGKLLAEFPDAVRFGVQDFLTQRCAERPMGAFGQYGPIERIRTLRFNSEEEVRDHVDAAYILTLGIRLSNETNNRGTLAWVLELLNEDPVVSPGAEQRAWALPDGVPLLSSWASRLADGDPLEGAMELVLRAAGRNHWVRMHTYGGSELRVDVFDVPPPVMEEA